MQWNDKLKYNKNRAYLYDNNALKITNKNNFNICKKMENKNNYLIKHLKNLTNIEEEEDDKYNVKKKENNNNNNKKNI